MTDLPERNRENYSLKRFRGKDEKYYWNQKDKRNGAIVGASSEGYTRPDDCLSNLFTVTGWHTFDVDDCVAA